VCLPEVGECRKARWGWRPLLAGSRERTRARQVDRGGTDTAQQQERGPHMKILQVVPKPGTNSKLKTMLKNTERHLRGPHTTFHRMREGRWKHVKYPGWIQWDEAAGGLLVAEIHTKGERSRVADDGCLHRLPGPAPGRTDRKHLDLLQVTINVCWAGP